MGFKQELSQLNTQQRGDTTKGAAFNIAVPNGEGFIASKLIGIMPAAIAANSCFFAMRLSPASTKKAYIKKIRLAYTTIAAFTVPVTFGRRIGIYRGAGAAATGGVATPINNPLSTAFSGFSNFDASLGGDMRSSTAAVLGIAGITFEAEAFEMLSMVHTGAAGGFTEEVFDTDIVLEPGQLLALRNPQVFDAGGTWQTIATIEWREAPAFGA